jgi:membrane-associated protein
MELLTFAVDFVLHIDRHLLELFQQYGPWIYGILFLIVFCETGLVVTPFLPGDSLLFAAGALAAAGGLDVHLMAFLLWVAAVLGDTVNYAIGRHFGMRLFRDPDSKVFRLDYLERTQRFYAKYGAKTIVIARFVPIVRTFAPFVAGMGSMEYRVFLLWNVAGAAAWVVSFTYAGYFFGGLPAVKENFTLLIFGIILVSVTPVVYEAWKAWRLSRGTRSA